jgi:hypothetical protein
MSVNIANCFIFVGAWSPISLYLTATLLIFDVMYACLRVYIEVGRLKKIEQQYHDRLMNASLCNDEREQIMKYLLHLQQRIAYEKKRLYIPVALTITLVLALALTFPFFVTVSPVIPLIGALLAMIAPIGYMYATKRIEKQKPSEKIPLQPINISPLASHGLFKTKEDISSNVGSDPELSAAPSFLNT